VPSRLLQSRTNRRDNLLNIRNVTVRNERKHRDRLSSESPGPAAQLFLVYVHQLVHEKITYRLYLIRKDFLTYWWWNSCSKRKKGKVEFHHQLLVKDYP